MGMLLTGDMVDADTAARWGLVNAVVPPDPLAAAVTARSRIHI
jgi:enoyl-CoA hydratase/carnithine racemase